MDDGSGGSAAGGAGGSRPSPTGQAKGRRVKTLPYGYRPQGVKVIGADRSTDNN